MPRDFKRACGFEIWFGGRGGLDFGFKATQRFARALPIQKRRNEKAVSKWRAGAVCAPACEPEQKEQKQHNPDRAAGVCLPRPFQILQ